MLISIVNLSRPLSDAVVQKVVRAINVQLERDVEPYWHFGGTCRLEGPTAEQPDFETLSSLRGEAIIYLLDTVSPDDVLGYHDANARGIPFGCVFTQLSKELGEPWSVTLSHEVLELVGDANVNTFAAEPHPDPRQGGRTVFHWWELCDAVQNQSHSIDGVRVSDFVLPLYFTPDAEPGGRNNFLGQVGRAKPLDSFGVTAGGYVGFYDPELGDHDTFTGGRKARDRMTIKSRAGLTRRSLRYKQQTTR